MFWASSIAMFFSAYCIMFTKGRIGLVKFDWVRLSVMLILFCTFVFLSILKCDWSTTDSPLGRISDLSTLNLKDLRGFRDIEGMDKFRKISTSRSPTLYDQRKVAHSTFNLRPNGGGDVDNPFPFFFQIAKKKQRTAPPFFFCTPYNTSFPHTLWKFQTQITLGKITRPRQVTSPHKKFECSSKLPGDHFGVI